MKNKFPYKYRGTYLPDGTHVLSEGKLTKETISALIKMVKLAKEKIK